MTFTAQGGCQHRVVTAFPDDFVGVGVELKNPDDLGGEPVVVRLIRGGPAHVAGIEPADRLTAIDRVPTAGVGLAEVVARLRGQEGSSVVLTLNRAGTEIVALVVRTAMKRSDEGYVTVTTARAAQ